MKHMCYINIEHIFTASDHFVTKSSWPTSSESSGHYKKSYRALLLMRWFGNCCRHNSVHIFIHIGHCFKSTRSWKEEREKKPNKQIYDLQLLSFCFLFHFLFRLIVHNDDAHLYIYLFKMKLANISICIHIVTMCMLWTSLRYYHLDLFSLYSEINVLCIHSFVWLVLLYYMFSLL